MRLHRLAPLALAALAAVSAPALAAPTSGIDAAGIDATMKPGDDFFDYANGRWVATTEIPSDRSSYGTFVKLIELTTARTREIMEQAAAGQAPAGSEGRKVGDYYAAYMDEAGIEARGVTPAKAELDRIAAISDAKALAAALGATLRTDVDPLNATDMDTQRLFGLFVAQDLNAPEHNTAYLLQGGLGMPDREYYLADSPRMADIRAKYQAHIAQVLTLAGIPDATAKAAAIFALETAIAKTHTSREDSEDVHKADNPWTRADFAAKAPGLDWDAYFAAAGIGAQKDFVVWQPEAVTGEAALVASTPLETWKAYLAYLLLNTYSGVLPKAFVDERFAFYGKTLSGTPELAARWKRAVNATNGALGDAVGQLYVAKYFPPSAKAEVQQMVVNIKAAMGQRIEALDWMSPQTKAQAKAKLATLIVGVGYPDTWRSYAALQISRDDAFGNAVRAETDKYHHDLAKLGAPVDRREWWMTPQTVNAVNLPLQNGLNFPAAILQPPFFDPAADPAAAYGAIGGTIGHEISHSFDDQGSQFDSTGKLANWWTPADLAHFRASADRLAAQFDAYTPFPDLHVKGRQTLSENIADVAGISAAYDAYKLSLHGKPAPVIDGLTGDQRFFLAFAQTWRSKEREAGLRQQVLTDGHAPAEYRADTVRNVDAWYGAFPVKPGEKLYLAPADRVRVW